MQTSCGPACPSLRGRGRIHLVAVAILALAGSPPAQAIRFWDEVTLYLTDNTYSPGSPVGTTFYFGSKPAVELSSFDFTISWDNALASSVASGPGSVAAWTTALSNKGSTNYAVAGPQVIKGGWTADLSGGSSSFISTSYNNLEWAVFAFETKLELNSPFVVSIELTNIKDSTGEVMDLGSGFINWATMTPVPEPTTWVSLACGLALMFRLRSRPAA
jgi:hypothetical protein